MPKQVTLTKIPLNDQHGSMVRWTFVLRGFEYDENGDPIPSPVADRLHAGVHARVDRDDGEDATGRGQGLVKQAVLDGAITQAEGLALKTILLKLYNYNLSDYA